MPATKKPTAKTTTKKTKAEAEKTAKKAAAENSKARRGEFFANMGKAKAAKKAAAAAKPGLKAPAAEPDTIPMPEPAKKGSKKSKKTAAAEVDAGPGECQSCRGYGYFREDGEPTIDKAGRKCLDCSGTGIAGVIDIRVLPGQEPPAEQTAEMAAAETGAKKMSAVDAAAKVLVEAGEPMNTKAMIEAMAAKGYWTSPGGKTPAATLYSAILREIGAKGDAARFRKTDPGHFAAATGA